MNTLDKVLAEAKRIKDNKMEHELVNMKASIIKHKPDIVARYGDVGLALFELSPLLVALAAINSYNYYFYYASNTVVEIFIDDLNDTIHLDLQVWGSTKISSLYSGIWYDVIQDIVDYIKGLDKQVKE
jgi:hypothetical protein